MLLMGERTTLNLLFEYLRELTGKSDPEVLNIKPVYGPVRGGDILHSLASIDKAKLLGYSPVQNVQEDWQSRLYGTARICNICYNIFGK